MRRLFGSIVGMFVVLGCLMGQPQSPYSVGVYPNPFSEQVHVAIELYEGDTLAFELFNLFGERLLSFPRQTFLRTRQVSFLTDSLPAGVYFTAVHVNSERMLSKIISKEKAPTVSFHLEVDVRPYPEDDFLIYPNPLQASTFTMELFTDASQIKASLNDLEGRELFNTTIDNPAGFVRESFDATSLPAGLYFLVVEAGKKRTVRRLVKP